MNYSTLIVELSLLYFSFAESVKIDKKDTLYPLAIIHINDFHARFEETNIALNRCKAGDKCIGGYARTVTVVKQLQEKHKEHNTIYLNAGDSFQGTLWYNFLRWRAVSYFLNLLRADAMVLYHL